MLGFSVYLNQPLDTHQFEKMASLQQAGFTGVFTSLHIPEEDATQYLARLKTLGAACQRLGLTLTADVSAAGMRRMGLAIENPNDMMALGVTTLRIDDGVEMATIASLSQQLPIALNASTITTANILALKAANANFDHLEAWHNYYPRPETGLDEAWLKTKNQWLQAQGFTTMAFVAGDAERRGPIKAGLPTLECDRNRQPLAAALNLLRYDHVDRVYIGDPALSCRVRYQFEQYFKNDILQLTGRTTVPALYDQLWHNRIDVARDVVRLVEGRQRLTAIMPVPPVSRPIGAITIDNDAYGRYVGELQLIKRGLAPDQRVNVVGQISAADVALLPLIGGNQAVKIIKEEPNQ
ncbi:DUF871 domain-containing protein [Lactobacillus sp. CBA3605]|uniref:MupG family TIM beta-alpha barrel fold protein n=1 Tax=Lactobacillus sp. CBA3605 TaxID=2099788 RepID=UPI000CFCF011|nr:MupG family TIM beta-alpha barrel fold protein [Lactobacillus sp. CBA3605]AVK60370.1 DUF871 domain-containing protein [Lactobacillus sp. CBA3605]